MSSPDIRMLENRMDKLEERTENWNKLLHGMADTVTLMFREQKQMMVDISELNVGQKNLKVKMVRLEEGQVQLALAQVQNMVAVNEIREQQKVTGDAVLKILALLSYRTYALMAPVNFGSR